MHPSRRRPPLRLESLEDRATPTTVNDPGDAGAANPKKSPDTANGTVTLRSMFDYANKAKTAISVDFAGGMTITLGLALQTTEPVQITGQSGGNGPTVIISGGGLSIGPSSSVSDVWIENGSGLEVKGGSTIRDSVFTGDEFAINLQGNGCTIQGNMIGVKPDGTTPDGNFNGIVGYSSGSLIGGTSAADRNIISNNGLGAFQQGFGIQLYSNSGGSSNGDKIFGNYIGTDATGTVALPNQEYGIQIQGNDHVIGGTAPGEANLIVASTGTGTAGIGAVWVQGGSHNQVIGNLIGTKIDGNSMFSNPGNAPGPVQGVYCQDNGTASGDLVSDNVVVDAQDGIQVRGDGKATSGFTIVGNKIGVGQDGTTPLRNGNGITVYDDKGTVIGGTGSSDRNVIAGNTGVGIGLFAGATGVKVEGNYIGVDASGTTAQPNGGDGVFIQGSSKNTIGGTSAADRNVISGNTGSAGVEITGDPTSGAADNVVEGNFIGTDVNGSAAIPNGAGTHGSGVLIDDTSGSATGNTIGGKVAGARNVISGNQIDGIFLSGQGVTTSVVEGNVVGLTGATGNQAIGNGQPGNGSGIDIKDSSKNTIGGTTSGARNVISGNVGAGISILASSDGLATGNVVEGNYVGTDVAGAVAVPNQGPGVFVKTAKGTTIGGTSSGARNVIAGNKLQGIQIQASAAPGNTIEGNYVGLQANGSTALANDQEGILIADSPDVTIGGSSKTDRNVISGNTGDGISVSGTSTNVMIQGNYVGVDSKGATGVGNQAVGILISTPASATVGGTAAGDGNVIADSGGAGIEIDGQSTPAVSVEGNLIGTNAKGSAALGNNGPGIYLTGTANVTIGGTTTHAGNLISGNMGDGIQAVDSGGNAPANTTIQGNTIGTDVTRKKALANTGDGIDLIAATGTMVGGTTAGTSNVISGNGKSGVEITGGSGFTASGNTVAGNYIGTNGTGTAAVANQKAGVVIDDASGAASGNTIGGVGSGTNVISGNGIDGVLLSGSGVSGNLVAGNTVGTNAAGSAKLGNGTGTAGGGIDVLNSNGNTIGGTATGAGNLVSGNNGAGVSFLGTSTMNVLQGNRIGTDKTGKKALGNAAVGVDVQGNQNAIGGSAAGANTIAFNAGDGVLVSGGTGNPIRQNSIFGNGGLGIDLTGGGNAGLAAPTLTTAVSGSGSTVTLSGTYTPNAVITIDIYGNATSSPQGQVYLETNTVTVGSDGKFSFQMSVGVSKGAFLTVTVNDGSGNTSEFSNAVKVS